MSGKQWLLSLGLGILLIAAPVAAQGGWVAYRAAEYGFSMLMPAGTAYAESEGRNGWAALRAEYEGVNLYALTKRGEQASEADIERVGIELTGIPRSEWRVIAQGRNQGGWNWYYTVEASRNGRMYVGDYGTGPSGSYLLLLETTESDYNAHRADYITWYQSIRVF